MKNQNLLLTIICVLVTLILLTLATITQISEKTKPTLEMRACCSCFTETGLQPGCSCTNAYYSHKDRLCHIRLSPYDTFKPEIQIEQYEQ